MTTTPLTAQETPDTNPSAGPTTAGLTLTTPTASTTTTKLTGVSRPARAPRPRPTGTSLTIVHWADPVIDDLGHDPRSWYVETFWLGVLGPSTTWLLRRIVAGFETGTDEFTLPLGETARRLGLGDKGGKHSPFYRAIDRLVQFHMARWEGPNRLAVRRRVPPLTLRQLEGLSPSLKEQHRRYQESLVQQSPEEALLERCRRLALTLIELGEDCEAAEAQLHRWRFHPGLSSEAVAWAQARVRHPSYTPR